jgi:hypothetical protein
MSNPVNTSTSFGEMISVDFGQLVAAAGQLRQTAGDLGVNVLELESALESTKAMEGDAAAALNSSKAQLFQAIHSTIMTLNKWADVVETGAARQKQDENNRKQMLSIQNAPMP